MIRYALTCQNDHHFDGWFQSAAAFDGLRAAGHVTCAICGSADVLKSLMAPAVGNAALRHADDGTGKAGRPDLRTPASPAELALARMRAEIEANSEYVGLNFATEARAIHDGNAPERAIYGEARFDEARKLLEDGVPVAPLPFMPPRRTN